MKMSKQPIVFRDDITIKIDEGGWHLLSEQETLKEFNA